MHSLSATSSSSPSSFDDLGLRAELTKALVDLGYEEPTSIQREAIPTVLRGHDVLGQAATGTGKTAAFALPILQCLAEKEHSNRGNAPMALILVPTRELAVQVSEAIHRYGREVGARVVPIYGGQPIGRQLQALERGVDVVVATPGRAVDHIKRKKLRLDKIEMVVLDEADEMLDMGFADELEEILSTVPHDRQTVLFSATLPKRIDAIARRHLTNPVHIQIEREAPASGETPRVRQTAYVVSRSHKPAAIGRILDVEVPTAAIVFCRTRDEVDKLTDTLNGRGYRAEALHGGMNQEQRDRVMQRLRSENADLLIATDVAARGLDIDHLTHVINYDVPSGPETYVHRIGRVGRAGREGVAITLTEPREHRMLKTIERVTKQQIETQKVPTVADLRERRLHLTRASLQEALSDKDDRDHYRVVVESLSDEFDVMEIALAAVKMVHEMKGVADEQEIPDAHTFSDKKQRDRGSRERVDRNDKRSKFSKGNLDKKFDKKRGPRRSSGEMTRVFVGVGKSGGISPRDLVGAIAGESSLSGRDIGSIEIGDRFSLVEIPSSSVNEVIRALKGTKIKGQKANVRRERFERH